MFMLVDTKYKGIEVETISKEVDLEDRTDKWVGKNSVCVFNFENATIKQRLGRI